jgi:ATP-binding cassette, subfamily B, bacterial PglK
MQIIKKILILLSFKEKIHFLFLICLILLMSIIDMLGVASILPFVTLLSNPDMIQNNLYISKIYEFSSIFGIYKTNDFLIFFGVLVLALLVFSLLVRSITTYLQIKFALLREFTIGKMLVEKYLNQPYEWFLSQNTSDLGKNVLSEVKTIIDGALMPFVNLIAQFCIVLTLLALLIFVDYKIALGVGFLLIFSYSVIFFTLKNHFLKIGDVRLKENQKRFSIVSEMFLAIKEIKIRNLQAVYLNLFSKPSKIYVNSQSVINILSLLPRYFLEFIAFGGMLFLVLLLLNNNSEFEEIIPILALYTVAGYRLIPALQSVYYSVAHLRFTEPILDKFYKDIKALDVLIENNTGEKQILFKEKIELKNISFAYPGRKKNALNTISTNIIAGSKVGIIGATGSGKSTLLNIITGLLKMSNGDIFIDNVLLDQKNKVSWCKNIGYVPQHIFLSDDTLRENIAFGIPADNIDDDQIKLVSKIAQLDEFASYLPNKYMTKIGEKGIRLSGGQQQRIGIARSLYYNPKLLILDEATSALDTITEKKIMSALYENNKNMTIIIVAHRINTLDCCDKIIILENSQIKAECKYENLNSYI